LFEPFFSRFAVSAPGEPGEAAWVDDRLGSVVGYHELMAVVAGCSFNDGIYRLHSKETAITGQATAIAAFPSLEGRGAVFAYDWLGRQFALDFARLSGDQPMVLMLEPGTGEALEIPATFVEFHDTELTQYADAALASEFFASWAAVHPDAVPLGHSDCVGYLVPLFLGGEDAIENLELVEFDVYWSVLSQILQQTRDGSDGDEFPRSAADD
jgi:hypothetical protein